jgi:TPP-dependent 2-oxoacid decarboxylase
MSEPNTEWTVARYLAVRLEQLGIGHLFGVPGNHLGPFLSVMHELTKVRWIGTSTEIGAGYAADAYARAHGVGAAAVTYSVGAFSLLNPIGGAYVEYVPIVAINACPTYQQWLNYQAVGLLTSHMSQRRESNLDVYRQVTVDSQVISNPGLAPVQIDSALTACLSERRPVYLEVMEDVWAAPCEPPQGQIIRRERPFTKQNKTMLDKAVQRAVDLIERLGKPILWGGEEVDRYGLAAQFKELVGSTGIQFCTTVGGKSILSENTDGFLGVYNGKASDPAVREVFHDWAKVRIGLGSWSTSKNLGDDQAIGDDWVVAAREGVSVGALYFPDVQLARFIPALQAELLARGPAGRFAADYYAEASAAGLDVPESTEAYLKALEGADGTAKSWSYDGFFTAIGEFLARNDTGEDEHATNPYVVISDAGFSLLGSMNLPIAEQDGYVAQNSWLSIGYSVGATTGIAMARPEKRPLVFVGDGSFQEVCQELSTQTRHGLNPVVFVLNNEGFYGIEQMLVHPCYYKEPPAEDAAFYNVLHQWNYDKLAEVFGSPKTPMAGVSVGSFDELADLLGKIEDPNDLVNRGPLLVQVRLSRNDFPRALNYKLAGCE